MVLPLDGPQWQFTVAFYKMPEVSEACLALQEACDVDVVQLIFAIYACLHRGIYLHADQMAEANTYVATWRRETVLPLRTLRRALKNSSRFLPETEKEALRSRIKTAEIFAEQVELAMLAGWLEERQIQPQDRSKATSMAAVIEKIVTLFAGAETSLDLTPEAREAMTRIIGVANRDLESVS